MKNFARMEMKKIFLIACLAALALLLPAFPRAQADDIISAGSIAALDADIDALGENLRIDKDLSVSVNRRFLNELATQFANASPQDLLIKVLPCRVMSNTSDLGFAKYQNYLDLEGGDGFVDLRAASVEGIKNGRIHVLVDAAGLIKTAARGKEIGIGYNAAPQIGVSLHDSIAFVIEPAEGEFRLRPLAKRLNVHLDINVDVPMVGKTVNASQDMPFDIASVMRPITLPNVISTDLRLPKQTRSLALTDAGYQAENGKLRFEANLNFSENVERRATDDRRRTAGDGRKN
jgi:hypothetical protein